MGVGRSQGRGPARVQLTLYGAQVALEQARIISRKTWEERLIRLLLLLPFIGLMIVPFYNIKEPVLLCFPFFYCYQLGGVPLTLLLTYRSVRDAG